MDAKDLLQINATIIAGLLILLTIQSFTGEIRPLQTKNEWQNKISELEVQQHALNKTLTTLYEKAKSSSTQERADDLQQYIDQLSTDYLLVTFSLEKMKKTEFRIIDEYGKNLSVEEELAKPSFLKTVRTYGIVLLAPFVASSVVLMNSALRKDEMVNAKKLDYKTAKILTLIGFVFLLIGLAIFNYSNVFGQ